MTKRRRNKLVSDAFIYILLFALAIKFFTIVGKVIAVIIAALIFMSIINERKGS